MGQILHGSAKTTEAVETHTLNKVAAAYGVPGRDMETVK
jgi:hypothetical protein